jgi:Transcriptional repressor TCF25
LLQVSEIAKHQSDHAVSADLLERALFNIGRSAHSSFGTQLQAGKAKLDFIQTENRELWLTVWRYIANLGMKGTWRTAYEWAKLLLSLDTKDPYCMRLIIDHLALRGRQYEHFISLCTETVFKEDWESYPNIQCSLSLAYLRLNKPKEARQQLRSAMSRYPWIFNRLAQELDIQPIPKRIWGKMPPAQSHELLTELYISRAKDLWNTPEVISVLVEIADTLSDKDEPVEPPEISLDIARHVVLSDIPRVTTHLPTRFTTGRISASDPLPPYESEAHRQQTDPVPSYISRVPEGGQPQWLRDLLGRMNIDPALLNGPVDDDDDHHQEDGNDGIPDLESIDGEHATDSTPPSSDDQGALRQWLFGPGVLHLRRFLLQYGVDRGNWGDDVEDEPLRNYVEGLMRIDPWEDREELLYGPIQDLVGEMVVDLLEVECQAHY